MYYGGMLTFLDIMNYININCIQCNKKNINIVIIIIYIYVSIIIKLILQK